MPFDTTPLGRRSVEKGVEEGDMAATPPSPQRPATINLPARIKSRLRSSESPQSVGGRESPSGLPSPSPTASLPSRPSSPYRLRARFERNVSLASLAPSPASIGRKVSAVSLTALEKAEKAAKSERYKTWDYELDKFTGLTTFHGLVRLYHSSWKFKVFWLAVIAVATALFMMQMVNLFDIVSAKPTVSQVRFNFSNNGTRFPVVTVCNYNPVTLSYVNQLNASGDMPEEVLKYIMLTYLQVENLAEYSNETLQHWHQQYQKYKSVHEDFDVADFFHRAAQPCPNMFKKCSFGGKPFDCCAHAEPVLTDIGQCYQFNSFSNRTWKNRQYISGVFYGLQLILDVNRSDYTEVYMDNFFEIGVRFFVHSHGQLPYLSTGGLSLSPGNRLYAGITPIHYQLLPREEWGNCKADYAREEVETLGLAVREDGGPAETYTASNCEAHCVSTQFANRCDCVPMRYKTHDTTNKVCEPAELLSCLHSHAIDEDEEYWYKLCPNCLMECDRWDYQLQTSYAEFPNRGAKKYFEKKYNYTEAQVVRDLAVLDLFLKEISFTEYEQIQATTWTETFSDIGGNMGLFLGMSAITIAEVSVFLMKCCWGSASAKRRAKVLKRRNSVPSQLDVVPEEPSQRPSDPALRRPAQVKFTIDNDD